MTQSNRPPQQALSYTLLTKEAVAELLSVAPRTIELWVQQQYLPRPTAIGRRVYWRADQFQRWLDAHFEAGSHPPSAIAPAPTQPDAAPAQRTVKRRLGRPRTELPATLTAASVPAKAAPRRRTR